MKDNCLFHSQQVFYERTKPVVDEICLNKGCVLSQGPNVYRSLFVHLRDMAKRNNIQFQIEASPYPTGTDANIVQISSCGVKTAVVSIPCRYMHTPYEIVSLHDINSASDLLFLFLVR